MKTEYQYRFYNHMTQDMLDNLVDFNFLKREIELCNHMIEEVKKAGNIQLPAKAASGEPVLHGSRNQMNSIREYWNLRAYAATELISMITLRKY